MLGIIGGITMHLVTYVPVAVETVQASVEVPIATTTAQVVLLEVVKTPIDWTAARIKQEINTVFHDALIMHKVMICESEGNTNAYNPTNNSHDNGLFQISAKFHGARMRALKLDVADPADNIAFARMLYDESGLNPWSASKHCWNK